MKRVCVFAALAAISSLTFVSTAAAEVRAGKNYRMTSDTSAFRGKDQLGMAVNPNNPQHIVAVHCEYLTQQAEGTRSLDGGQTWSNADNMDLPASTPPFQPGCRISDHLAESMFQTVEFGTGNVVYATFQTPKTTIAGGEEGSSVFLAKSTDGGLTWGTSVQAMVGGASPVTGPYWELPTVAVDRGAGTGGADRVVIAARETTAAIDTGGDATVAVSNDGGQTFSAPVRVETAGENVAGPDSTSQPVILDDHSIVLSWRTLGGSAFIKSSRSIDGGQTWSPPVIVTRVTAGGNTSNTNPPVSQQSTGSTFPRMAVDRSPAQDRIYLVYNQGSKPTGPTEPDGGYLGADHFIHHESDVYFQRSLDNGATWSRPKLINDIREFPGNQSPGYGSVTQTRHPSVFVAPPATAGGQGRVDIVWEDRRHWYRGCIHTHVICDEARLGDTFYSYSKDGGSGFSPDQRITDRHHNNDVGYDYRFGVGWAFGPVAVPMGTDELLIGWMDSREGSFETDINDIYLSRVSHSAPAAPPQETLTNPGTPRPLSVALSKHTYLGGGESLLASTFATRNGTKVVIVNENDYPAILASGVLARANLSQVLLSPAAGLPPDVVAEVTRMNPAGAYLVGNTGELSSQVVSDLEGAGVPNDAGQIERIGTGSDAEMARDIAAELDRRTNAQTTANEPAFHSVAVVNPASPDSAAVAGLAAHRRLPILFTNPDPAVNTLPAATTQAIADQDINDALVIGGTQWVNNTVAGQLPSAQRLGGADQYETSDAVVAESVQRGVPRNIAYVANGAAPIDAALLGSAVGRIGALLQLAPTPVGSNGADRLFNAGLGGVLDRVVVVQAAQTGGGGGGGTPTYPGPGGGGGVLPFAGCPSGTTNPRFGGPGNDSINGTPAGDRIFAGTGNDVVDGLAGNDCIDLGPGTDRGQGGLGDDLILGGLGVDQLSGSSGNDTLRGNGGNDRINGGLGNDRIHGLAGRDRISASRGRDRVNGGSSGDTISGGSSGDRIAGDAGSDRINGNSGNDRISGNSGRDRIRGSSGRDRIRAGSGRDRINVRDGQVDRVNCGSGTDRVVADASDVISGNCEIVSRSGASAAGAGAVAGSLGLPALAGGAYVALLGWRRRRTGASGL